MKCLTKTKCRQPVAFTLIELLVVIAIISLLVSILLPSLNQAKDLAKKTLCMTQVRSLGMAMNLYADEYGDKYIPFYPSLSDQTSIIVRDPSAALSEYVGGGAESKMWSCPGDDGNGIWRASMGNSPYYRSYAANGYVVGCLDYPARAQINSGSETLLLCENWTGFPPDRMEGFMVDNIWDQVSRSGDNAQLHFAKPESSCAFVDGHIEYLDYMDINPDGVSGKGRFLP